jgi:DNA-binding IclR family transcriptional regulator
LYDTSVSLLRQADYFNGVTLNKLDNNSVPTRARGSVATQRETSAGIQVISRAAAILRALKEQNSGMSLGQIAEKIDLPRSTVQRIVAALEDERLVMSSGNGGGIRLGPELLSLGIATRYNIVEQCRPYLEALRQRTGETVDLAVMRGRHMVFLDQVQGGGRLRTNSSIGEEFPITTTANGRACLALLDRTQARTFAQQEWAEFGIKDNWSSMEKQLDQIKRTNIAYDLNDHTTGISAIGFAFRDSLQDLHAISMPIPSSRYAERSTEVIAALKETRSEVLRDLSA